MFIRQKVEIFIQREVISKLESQTEDPPTGIKTDPKAHRVQERTQTTATEGLGTSFPDCTHFTWTAG